MEKLIENTKKQLTEKEIIKKKLSNLIKDIEENKDSEIKKKQEEVNKQILELAKKSKKFSFQRMFKLMDSMCSENGEKQHQLIDKTLSSWMREEDQTDDMVFLGLKV